MSQPTEPASQKGMSCFAWLVVCLEPQDQAALLRQPLFHFLLVFLFAFHLLWRCVPSTCRAEPGRTRTAPMIVYFGICLIAHVAVCIFFTVFVVVGLFFFFFFFPFPILVCVLFPCPHWLSVFLKVLNTKMLTERKIVLSAALTLQRFCWKICHAEFYCKLEDAFNSFEGLQPLWQKKKKSHRPF